MDYKIEYYHKAKKAFLDTIRPECRDKEDASQCIEKHTKAFDIVFESLKTELDKENELLALYKNWITDAGSLNYYDPEKL
jgi:hypothetical protein